jgi:hypothetical protein
MASVREMYRDRAVECGVLEVTPDEVASENAGSGEQMHGLHGDATVTSEDGSTLELCPGVSFVARPGCGGGFALSRGVIDRVGHTTSWSAPRPVFRIQKRRAVRPERPAVPGREERRPTARQTHVGLPHQSAVAAAAAVAIGTERHHEAESGLAMTRVASARVPLRRNPEREAEVGVGEEKARAESPTGSQSVPSGLVDG